MKKKIEKTCPLLGIVRDDAICNCSQCQLAMNGECVLKLAARYGKVIESVFTEHREEITALLRCVRRQEALEALKNGK